MPSALSTSSRIPVQLRLIDQGVEEIEAEILGVRGGLFQLGSPAFLQRDRAFEIVCAEHRILARVVSCSAEPSGSYRLGARMVRDEDRRREPRFPTDLDAKLLIGSSMPMSVKVTDVSFSGVGLEAASPIPVGAVVSVDVGFGIVSGEIRHCTSRLGKFRAGMRLHEFVLSPRADSSSTASVMHRFLQAMKERQSRYEAMLLSLSIAAKKK